MSFVRLPVVSLQDLISWICSLLLGIRSLIAIILLFSICFVLYLLSCYKDGVLYLFIVILLYGLKVLGLLHLFLVIVRCNS